MFSKRNRVAAAQLLIAILMNLFPFTAYASAETSGDDVPDVPVVSESDFELTVEQDLSNGRSSLQGDIPAPDIDVQVGSVSTKAMAAASTGTLIGTYNKVTWELDLSTGKLTVSGSGAVARGWTDEKGNDCSSSIKSVTIESGLTSLSDGAFSSCANLKSVSLPSTVKTIGANAFNGCGKLTSVSLPTSVTSIGDYAFANCNALTKVTLPSKLTSLGEYAFGLCTSLQTANIPQSLSSIPEGLFYECDALGNVSLHSGLTDIGAFAFYGCDAITTVDAPCAIGAQAFENCANLSVVTLAGNPGFAAFQSCGNLKQLTLKSTVTEIGEGAFNLCVSLEALTVPGNVKAIGERAFGGCESLREAQINSGCTSLGDYAFLNCSSLSQVSLSSGLIDIGAYCFASSGLREANLPSGLKHVQESAFFECRQLMQVSIPASLESLGAHCFESCDALKSVIMPNAFTSGLTRLDESVFAKCGALESIDLPDNLTSIAGGTFGLCAGLTDIDIPDGCSYIGDQAFYGCSSLKQIRLPSALTQIGSAVFYGCTSLTDINVPGKVKGIGSHAFAFCDSLRNVILPASLKTIEQYAFSECPALVSILIPSSVRIIGNDAFAHTAITSVSLPSGLESLGDEAFAMCDNLSKISLPTSITAVPDGCFFGCVQLKDVALSPLTTQIGRYAFADCSCLGSIYLPSTLATVGESAFLNCNALQSAPLGASMTRLDENAFANCGALKEVYIGPDLDVIGDYALAGCDGLESITVAPGNANYSSQDGVLYSKDGKKLIFYPPKKAESSFVMPAGVSELSPGALYNCENIKTLELSAGMTAIAPHAFYGCEQLENVVIPSNIQTIGEYAFAQCSGLKQVTLNEGIKQIGEGAFAGCSALQSLALPDGITEVPDWLAGLCESLKSVSLPSTVETIGSCAFFMCGNLKEINFPDGLTEIGNYSFAECSQLKAIELPKNVELIAGGAFDSCESIETVAFKGDVYYIGESAFANCASLERVDFAGNAPVQIGTNAFLNANEALMLVYPNGAEGFTTPVWQGPDSVEYQTATTYEGECGDKVHWKLDTYTGLMTISGEGEMYNFSAAEAAPWNDFKDYIRSVDIQEGVTRLGSMNFMSCANLESVSLPISLTETNYAAFADCACLSEVKAAGGLKSVAPCLFYNCYLLSDIELADSLEVIGEYAFYNSRGIETLVIPSSVKTVKEGAFAYCVSLTSVTFSGKPTAIDKGAFTGCGVLQSVFMNGGMPDSISEYAFAGIESQLKLIVDGEVKEWKGSDGNTYTTAGLDSLSGTCGSGVNWTIVPSERKLVIEGGGGIEDYTEDSAPWQKYYLIIEKIEVCDGVKRIGNYAFANLCLVNTVSLPAGLTSIGDYAFANCTSLNSLSIPSALEALGEGVFCDCVSLEAIELTNRLASVPDYCFYGCTGLKNVHLPSSATAVGYCAFVGCGSLEGVTIPGGVTKIDDYAFLGCYGLTSLTLPDALKTIGESAFLDCVSLNSVVFNSSLTSIGPYSFAETALTSVSLPGSVKTVGEYAFILCEELTSLQLGSVETIGDNAFFATEIEDVLIPSSVSSIGKNAFGGCTSLPAFRSQSPVYSSMNGVLYAGDRLVQYPAGRADETFVVPEHVTSIGEFAFYGTAHLKRVEIGDQVKSLGTSAFIYCDALQEVVLGEGITAIPDACFGACSQLTSLYFRGDAPTSIGDEAFEYIDALPVFHYVADASGWTEGTWVGPDGVSYPTAQVGGAVLIAEDVTAAIDANGTGTAQLKISTPGIDPIDIVSVTVDDARFSVSFDSEDRTVLPKQVYTGCTVSTAYPLDAQADYSVQVTIAWATGSAVCHVDFLAEAGYDYILLVKDSYEDGEKAVVTVKTDASAPARNCAVVLGVFSDSRMLAAKAAVHALYADHEYDFTFAIEKSGDASACQYGAFLLDADTLAPLSAPAQCVCDHAASGDTTSIELTDIREREKGASVETVQQSLASVINSEARAEAASKTALNSSAKSGDNSSTFAGVGKLVLIRNSKDEAVLWISYSDEELSVNLAGNYDNVHEDISRYDTDFSSGAGIGGKLAVSWKDSTCNKVKPPRISGEISANGYLLQGVSKKPWVNHTFKNGYSLDITPQYQVLAGEAGMSFVYEKGGKPYMGASLMGDLANASESFTLKTPDGKMLLKVTLTERIGLGGANYKGVGKSKFRWKRSAAHGIGAGIEIESDFETIIDILKEKMGDAAKDIKDYFLGFEYKDGDISYDLGGWYVHKDGEALEAIPMCVAPIDDSKVSMALPLIAQTVMPTLSDLKLAYSIKDGTIIKETAVKTGKTSSQISEKILKDIKKSGNTKASAAANRILSSLSKNQLPSQKDVNTINSFLNSNQFNNYMELSTFLRKSSGYKNVDNLFLPLEDSSGYITGALKGYAVINVPFMGVGRP